MLVALDHGTHQSFADVFCLFVCFLVFVSFFGGGVILIHISCKPWSVQCYHNECSLATFAFTTSCAYPTFDDSYAFLCNVYEVKLKTLRPRQNGRHFADDTFKLIFVNEKVGISIKMSLKFVPINNIPALVQIMAWRRPGDKPLS